MKPNLDELKTEIERYLEESGLAIFYGHARMPDSTPAVYWDCEQYPDYKRFVQAARTAGAKVIVFHQRLFSAGQVEDALEQLETCRLPRDEYRDIEQRLNETRAFDGSVCAIELSFDQQGRIFIFDLRTDWYEELTQILDEIEVLAGSDDEELGGYFSKN